MAKKAPSEPQPDPFVEVRTHEPTRGFSGLCAGYESQQWRIDALADHVMEWLPEFSLRWSERSKMTSANSVALIRAAAATVYKTQKFKKRGEFGELILHMAIRQVFDSLPAVSKIYYKTAKNDTVKGFDAVHVVPDGPDLELWIGEVKFYSSLNKAVADVCSELKKHLAHDYLRDEFLLLTNKIDNAWPHAVQLRKLLSPNTSLDTVFTRACVPVLLTYDSDCLSRHDVCSQQYIDDFKKEIETGFAAFKAKAPALKVRVHLFLMPLKTKSLLIQVLDAKLKIWQKL